MPKDTAKDTDSLAKLNSAYKEILGSGDPLTAEATGISAASPTQKDTAYTPEDYAEEEESETVDPRDVKPDSAPDEDLESDEEFEEEPEEEEPEETPEAGADEETEPIPDRLVQAGRRGQLSDETIIFLAEKSPQTLEALARAQDSASSAFGQLGRQQKEQAEPKTDEMDLTGLQKLELSPEFLEDPENAEKLQKTINSLVDTVQRLSSKLKTHDTDIQKSQSVFQTEQNRRIDSFFDRAAKEVPLLGNTKNLSQEAYDARLFAHAVAVGAQNQFGGKLNDEAALAIGVNALKGQFTEGQVKAKVVDDLNRHRKKFIARPRGRRESGQHRMTEAERAMRVINQKMDEFEGQ